MEAKPQRRKKDVSNSEGNYIDAFVKRVFGRILVFVDFLKWYADPEFVDAVDLAKIRPTPTHYIGKDGDERIVDLVFQCPLKDGSGNFLAVIIFEHQSGSLKKIPLKLLRYVSAIWDAEIKEGQKVLSVPYFIVLRTAKKPHRGDYPTIADWLPKGRDGKPLGHVPEIRYTVVDLPERNFSELAGGTELRLALGMLHKMTGGREDEFPEALLPLLEISDEEVQRELLKELLDFAAKAFAAHNRRLDDAKVSRALNSLFHGKEQTMMKTIFEEKFDEGFVAGEARGEARGYAVGEARGVAQGEARGKVLAILQTRFRRVPKSVEKTIRAMRDLTALESWAEFAATCESLAEFKKELH